MKLINGKEISAAIRQELRADCAAFVQEHGYAPGLAVVIVGENPASQIYVRNKAKACEEVGFYSEIHRLPESTAEAELLALIDRLNADSRIHGILVQLPLPPHLDADAVTLRIDPRKDVDAFHPYNVGRITLGDPVFLPCTPAGVMELLRRSGIDPAGRRCVVIGRSNIGRQADGAPSAGGKRNGHGLPQQNTRSPLGHATGGYSRFGGRSRGVRHCRYGQAGCGGH